MRLSKVIVASAVTLLFSASSLAASYNWRMYGELPPTHAYTKRIMQAFNTIKDRTHGQLNIQFHYFKETPYQVSDALRIVRDHLVEMAAWAPSYTAGTYPLVTAPGLLFLSPIMPTSEALQKNTDIAWQLPTIQQQFNKILTGYSAKPVTNYYWEPMNLWFTKPITGLKDIANLKVRAFTPEQEHFLIGIGALPQHISTTEQYMALQRNTVNGTVTGSGNLQGAKLQEVLKTGYIVNMSALSTYLIVARGKYDSLPVDVRQIFDEEMSMVGKDLRAALPKRDLDQQQMAVTEANMAMINATPEDYTKMRAVAMKSVWPAWAKSTKDEATANKILTEIGDAMSGSH